MAGGVEMNDRGRAGIHLSAWRFLPRGLLLLIFSLNESRSFSSDVSRFFTGNPTDRSIWLLVGGAVSVIAGLVLALRGTRHE